MNDAEILTHLPTLYFIKGERKKYDILGELNLSGRGRDYNKIKEFIEMGFLDMVDDNPPTFVVSKDCRNKIWKFIKETDIGSRFLDVIRDRTAVFE